MYMYIFDVLLLSFTAWNFNLIDLFLYFVVVAQQLDKNFQVRMTYSLAPGFSALQTMVTWDNENNHVAVAIQVRNVTELQQPKL